MKKVVVRVFGEGDMSLPKYETSGAAGLDVCAKENVHFEPFETKLVKTGLYVEIPDGYEIQVRPRSGLSLKSPLRVANSPGTIDSDYRGSVNIIMQNTANYEFFVKSGDRVAQLVLKEVPQIEWFRVYDVNALTTTERGSGGFGSTG